MNGVWREPNADRWIEATNPAKPDDVLARVAHGSASDVDAAMQAAHAAFPDWSMRSGFERAQFLYGIARAIAQHSRLFAVLESLDNGKTIRETRDIDVPLVIRHFYYHAGMAMTQADCFPGLRPGGVIGQIIPWNFPLLMLAWKIAPAIAAGNTVVLKPAEFTPLTAALFAEILMTEIRLPPGVVNIVFGDGETGEAIVKHDIPWKIAFTGSTEVGRIIRTTTAGTHKKLTMELGGKSPFIVFADADLDSVVEGVVDAIWFNQGQVCCAGSRLLVEESVAPLLIDKLKRRMKRLRGGDQLDKGMDFGALNSRPQYDKIRDLIERGKAEGATCWQAECDLPQDGWFVPPTLFTGVDPAHEIAQVEIFGPVMVSMTFRTPTEAIALANNTPYGLAASIWTETIGKANEVARGVKAGTVWINCTNVFDAGAGFGGYRQSGYGREGGIEGFHDVLIPADPTARAGLSPATRSLEPDGEGDGESSVDAAPLVQGPAIHRTYRHLIGGNLQRPDGGASFSVQPNGHVLGVVSDANRKDVRNAVEAAGKAQPGWANQTAHLRGQILYFLAENLVAQRDRFVLLLMLQRHYARQKAEQEFDASIERLFYWAANADKYGGTVQSVAGPFAVTAVNEPIGVIGIRAPDEFPLLGIVGTIGPTVAMGNTVVVVPGILPMSACDLIQVIQNSDVPAGVINILTASVPNSIAAMLASHMAVDAVWCFADSKTGAAVKTASAPNMKRVFVGHDGFDWLGADGRSRELLREATQVKNIWVPVGA